MSLIAPPKQPIEILIVEDSATQAASLEAILRERGFAVRIARDGRAGLSAVRTYRPELVISDVVMPDLSGFEMCKAIKADDDLRQTPVILLTSLSDPMDIIAGLESGADNFITKPYEADHLLHRIANLLMSRDLRRESGAHMSLQLSFMGKRYTITSEREQILDLLISTFEQAVTLNQQLRTKQDELKAINRELEVASAHKSRFLASMSHELRTPLNSILGFAELLQEPEFGALDEQQRKFVANIHTSGSHLLALINDILDLSKVAAGKIELHLESVNVNEVVQAIGDMLRPLAGRKKQTFTVHPTDVPLHVLADAARIKQMLYNLISNAIKFTPEGGHIDVRMTALPDTAEVSVQDDGIGIAEEDHKRIFEEFQQVDSALSRQFEGTGLGLALTRNLARLQRGDIRVDSALGKGSTFTFTLPRHAAPEAAAPNVRPADQATRAPRILVIEDDARARELITTHLTGEGYDVVHATDGEEGVRKARDARPFAIVLDILLPLKNGWDVLAELKASPDTASIPVVVVSVVDDQLRGFNLGAAGYLTKPVSRSALIAAVKNLTLTTKARDRRVQVLIVDDDPQARSLVVAALEPYGFQLLTATSGKEALRVVADARPDLVVLDLMMPDVNGFEVVEALKGDPATAEIPVVILSAKDLSQDERERLNGQVTARLDKRGFSAQRLLVELRKLEKWFPLKASIVDSLTALFNEVYFDKRLREEVARGERYGRQFSMALVNIDHFGDFNAAHGRQQGDLALQQFSRLVENTLRGADPVARLRGDLFGVLLPETVGARAVEAAEKLRATVQDEVFRGTDGGTAVHLTVSVGLACYPLDGSTPEALTDAARTALERARALNHNKVMTASPGTADEGPRA